MAKLQPYLEEDYKEHKLKGSDHNNNHNKAKNLSLFASIFSLFIYICVFYIFNLSPYTLFNKNIFWFFMSNTLILIIAADYEVFSSSKKKQDSLHQEYVKHNQTRNKYVSPPYAGPRPCAIDRVAYPNHRSCSYVPTCDEQVDKQCIIPKQELVSQLQHEKKEANIAPERVLEIVVQNQTPKKPSDDSNNEKKPILDDGRKKLNENRASVYRRSKSDRHNFRAKHVVIDERKNMVRRIESMKKIEPKVEEEENEFSKMTNEDLNRRVEEFIQKFNRQIRLQTTRKI